MSSMRWPGRKKKQQERLDREIQADLELEQEEQERLGYAPEEAKLRARRALGNATLLKEDIRAAWGWTWLERLLDDMRYAARQLRKNRAFALFSIATLAIGIGAATASFSILDPWLLRPLALKEPAQLQHLWRTSPANHTRPAFFFDYSDYLKFGKQTRLFSSMAATFYHTYTLTGRGNPEDVMSEITTANLFETLGVHAALGRTFLPEDSTGEKVAVLSYAFWSKKFGSSAAAIGQTLRLNDEPYRVVGVLPRDFSYRILDQPVDSSIWTVIQQNDPNYQQNSTAAAAILGRLKEGVRRSDAQEELNAIQKRMDRERPKSFESLLGSTTLVSPLQEDNSRQIRFSLLVLGGAVCFLLLIACANTCALILSRNETRHSEFATRVALGSSARRLFQQLFAENFLLYAVAAIAGLLMAAAALRGFELWNPLKVLPARGVALSYRTFSMAVGATFLTSILFGTLPAFFASRANLSGAIRSMSRSATLEGKRIHALTWITGVQISLALVLLTGAGLLFSTLMHLQNQNFGFDTAPVQTFGLSLPKRHYKELSKAITFEEQLLERLRQNPRVKSAAIGLDVTLGDAFPEVFSIAEHPGMQSSSLPRAVQTRVGPQFFETLKIPILEGSDFPLGFHRDSEPLAVMNELAVQRYFGRENPVGKHIRFGLPSDPNTAKARWYRIIGVVGSTRSIAYNNTAWKSDPRVYVDLRQEGENMFSLANWGSRKWEFLVASDSKRGISANELQRIVWSLDPGLPVNQIEPLTNKVEVHLAQPRMRAQVLTAFSGISMFLAAIGLYGVLAQSVAQRKREIAIRLALGADRKDVVRLVVQRALTIAAAGVFSGIVIACFSARAVRSVLYGISALNPALYAGAAATLFLVALLAAFIPARRAARVDPMASLRSE